MTNDVIWTQTKSQATLKAVKLRNKKGSVVVFWKAFNISFSLDIFGWNTALMNRNLSVMI